MTYTIGQTVALTTGEIGMIHDGYDNLYQIWVTGRGMLRVHGDHILRAA